jgi:hypothetical protein
MDKATDVRDAICKYFLLSISTTAVDSAYPHAKRELLGYIIWWRRSKSEMHILKRLTCCK